MATKGLARPGVEVVQEFRTESPTIIAPTLVPTVVGVAKQIVEVLVDDGSGGSILNADALITLPAFFIAKAATGSPPKYTGLDSTSLVFSVNNGPPISIPFTDTLAAGLTPATVVAQVLAALATLGVTTVTAETVGTDSWKLRTIGVGEFQFIYIDPTTTAGVLSAFGIGAGRTYAGLGNYNQYEVNLPPEAMPDPRGNLAELGVELDTIRVFAATSGSGGVGLTEFKRDQAFLRKGEVNVSAVSVEGTVDLVGSFPTITTETLVVKVDGGAPQTVNFATPADAAAVLSQVNAGTTGLTASLGTGTPNGLLLTSDTGGYLSSIEIVSGTALSLLGLVAGSDAGESIKSIDDGNGDAVTPLLEFAGQNFAGTPTVATMMGSSALTTVTDGNTLVISDGGQQQTIVFESATTPSLIIAAINAVMAPAKGGKITATLGAGPNLNKLILTHEDKGDQGYIKIIGGTALTELNLVAGASAHGTDFNPLPGDVLYIDGVEYATISFVAPGAVATRLKIDKQVSISTNVGRYFYIEAKNLVAGGTATRPYPDLQVDITGNVKMKHSLIRDTVGVAHEVVASVYVAYSAVRKDASASATNPGLLRFDDTTALTTALEPVTADNPLALGMFFALLNAPGSQVSGLGVDEVSDSAPYGTLESFTRAAEYLESFEIYAAAFLTHDKSVAEVFKTHVDFMSEPEQKGERICLWNPEMPTRALDSLVASGTDGDALSTTSFTTKVAALPTLVQNAGVSPVGTIPATEGLFLELNGKNYSISAIAGANVTIRTAFGSGENDDGFYQTSAMTLPIISESFAVKIRGAELLTIDGSMDKNAVAETMAALATAYSDRRFWMTFPDQCKATIGGQEQILEGFYMNAAIAGMIGQQPPQQSFTNFPMSGFTGVLRSNNFFTEQQLNVMAGGGVYIIIQDTQGAPLMSRMALTTNMTSIETRTDSITKVVDFCAKFLRRSLRVYIGRFNITQGFLDSLGSVVQGLLSFLVETGVLIGANLNNIIQDESAPDTVLIDVRLDVPYPCNYIRLTLII